MNGKPLPKEKDKKERSHPAPWWQKKCDDKMQDVGREFCRQCEVCGGPNQVGHHYITKSQSSFLRYEFKNLIPLCHSCHFKHHIKSDSYIHNTINRKRGQEWMDWIESVRRKEQKTSVGYYKEVFIKLGEKLYE